jgi:hypothetical protein
MRIKISKLNDKYFKAINIKDVEFLDKNDEGLLVFYFKCHDRYENYLLHGAPLRFQDSKGKELFRSCKLEIYFRYRESDSRQNITKFEVKAIEFEKLGLVSKHYLRNILRQCCNAKVYVPPPKEPPLRGTLKDYYLHLRFMDIVKSRLRKAPIYKYERIFRYIFKQIHRLFVINTTDSTAPT